MHQPSLWQVPDGPAGQRHTASSQFRMTESTQHELAYTGIKSQQVNGQFVPGVHNRGGVGEKGGLMVGFLKPWREGVGGEIKMKKEKNVAVVRYTARTISKLL